MDVADFQLKCHGCWQTTIKKKGLTTMRSQYISPVPSYLGYPNPFYSRMRSRRVPVLRLGSRGPGGNARSLRLCSQAFAIVRKGSQAFAVRRTCRRDENRREMQNCRHFLRFALQKCQQSQGSGGVVVAKPRTVVNFGLVFASQKCQQSQGSGGSWSRNPELSSLLESSRLFSHRDRGSWSRSPELLSLMDSPRVFASQECQQSQGSGGVVVAKPRTVVTFGIVSRLRVSKVSTVTGIGGSWSNPELSSLLESSRLFSHRDRGSWSRNPELSSLLDSPLERGKERGERRKER